MAMRKSRFTVEQIAHALRQAETGTRVAQVCRAGGERASKHSTAGRSSRAGWRSTRFAGSSCSRRKTAG